MGSDTETEKKLAGRTVVICEDTYAVKLQLKNCITTTGLAVVEVSTGDEALEALGKGDVSLLLIDMLIHPMKAYGVLEEMMKNDSTKALPVIIVTNVGDRPNIDKCKAIRDVEYIDKPIQKMELLTKIDTLVQAD